METAMTKIVPQRSGLKNFFIRSFCFISRPWQMFRLAIIVRKNPGRLRLNLGAGGRNIKGWINVDYNFRTNPDIVLDLTRKFPLPDGCAEFIFTEDFIEHLTRRQGLAFLAESHRVLAPGGAIRILTPDLELVVNQYIERNPDALAWYKNSFGAESAADMLNTALRGMEHKYLYDEETLAHTLVGLGFEVSRKSFGDSDLPEFRGIDMRKHSLVIDAIKKGAMKTAQPDSGKE